MRSRSGKVLSVVLALAMLSTLSRDARAVWSRFGGNIVATAVTVSGAILSSGNIRTGSNFLTSVGKVGVGTLSPAFAVHVSTGKMLLDGVDPAVKFTTATVQTSAASSGVIYFSTHGVFMVSEAGGIPKPIVDPPGNWTCTIRTGSATANISTSMLDSTATCSGAEKALGGGCRPGGTGSNSVVTISEPTGQGWKCSAIAASGTSMTMTAVANCCL